MRDAQLFAYAIPNRQIAVTATVDGHTAAGWPVGNGSLAFIVSEADCKPAKAAELTEPK